MYTCIYSDSSDSSDNLCHYVIYIYTQASSVSNITKESSKKSSVSSPPPKSPSKSPFSRQKQKQKNKNPNLPPMISPSKHSKNNRNSGKKSQKSHGLDEGSEHSYKSPAKKSKFSALLQYTKEYFVEREIVEMGKGLFWWSFCRYFQHDSQSYQDQVSPCRSV